MTITDVGSVRAPVRQAIESAGLTDLFVGGHPMAGNEHSGFANAYPQLLMGAPWALSIPRTTRSSDFQELRFDAVRNWVTANFDANVIPVDDDEHDEVQALISGLPHVLAVELLNLVADSPNRDLGLRLAAGSFRDGTRVAHTDPDRTHALVGQNPVAVANLLRKVSADLKALAVALESGTDTSGFFHFADSLRHPPGG
jgi:prephenate dehydrogenase